ncbi:hypothetical protein SDJN02_09424, partial [Cucurbita argyrosperma subsp. argyrosperma]
MGHHNPPPFWGQRPRWHSFLPPIDVGPPPNSPPLGPASLLAHRLVPTPLWGTTRRLAHRPVSGSDTISRFVRVILAQGHANLPFPFAFGFQKLQQSLKSRLSASLGARYRREFFYLERVHKFDLVFAS